MSFGFGFGFPSWRTLAGGFSPAALFVGGVQGAWYDPSDLSTLFTTSAGTTQCAMPGQGSAVSVGAMLDKRAAGYSLFFDGTGDYLSFASNSGLALGAGQYTVELWVYLTASVNFGVFFSVTGGLQFSTNASNNVAVALQGVAFELQSTTPVTLNQWVHLAATRDSGNTTRIFLNGSQIASAVITTNYAQGVSYANFNAGLPGTHHTGYYANLRVVKGTAVYTSAFTPPTAPLSPISGTSLLTCGVTWSGNPTITKNGDARVDGLNPFTASPVGNHAIAFNDTTARPELRARVNLLEYSEQFDNAYWSTANTTVSANTTTAPDGTTTADSLFETAASNSHGLFSTITLAGTSHVFSVCVKDNGRRYATIAITSGASDANSIAAIFDLQTGASTANRQQGTGVFVSASVAPLGNGWYRCTIEGSNSTSSQTCYPVIATSDRSGFTGTLVNNLFASYAGDITKGIYIWGADLRPANIGANVPAYQRIADANTYDTSGFPLYLLFDGIDDSMYTPANLNLSGTDKATVFAGVRKLSDGAGSYPLICEFSADWNVNDNCFILSAGGGVAGQYFVGVKGTTRGWYEPQTYSAPISNVLCAQYNLAGANLAAQVVPRVNGIIEQENPNGSSGTPANFGTYPLFIGSRGNSSLWFNGHLHSLIIAGSAVSAGNISATEQWVAGKTGITI